MSTKKSNKSEYDYEIDWRLTGQLAIQSNAELQEENRKLHEIRDNREEKIADLEIEIYKLKEHIKELEDELRVRKHSYKKLMKDKRLYEKARAVMFWPDEEDLYEDMK